MLIPMLVVFRSWGAVPLIAIPTSLAGMGALCDAVLFSREESYSLRHAWPIGVALVLAGAITFGAERFRVKRMYEEGHLLFVSTRIWPYLCFAAAALYLLVRLTGDA
jgi:hypothetical protein